jgi:photoactive yellow protein
MDHVSFQGVDLAELLPRIPDSIKNGLPFGLVKLDLQGTVLEYNMAEGDLTGVSPEWAIGKNFFDEVAVCTKTAAFYGRFLEGVKKGFLNTVFDYVFDHRDVGLRVKVHMVTIPDHLGRKSVMVLVKRVDQPVVLDAFAQQSIAHAEPVQDFNETAPAWLQPEPSTASAVPTPAATASPSIADIVAAVMAAMNQATPPSAPAVAAAPAPAAVPAKAPPPAASGGGSRHEDIIKF